jgi:hypothetical protein
MLHRARRLLLVCALSVAGMAYAVVESDILVRPAQTRETTCCTYGIHCSPAGFGDAGQQQGKAAAPKPADAPAQPQQQPVPADLESLIIDAQTAPAEFSADVLIRIAESGRVKVRAQQRRLLEDAFRRASEAQHPVRRRYAGREVDTRPGYLAYAFDLGLDTLSLQCRVVKAMLAVDAPRARELFSEIPKLKLQPLGCDDALVYDAGLFYETLTEVAAKTFTPEERRQAEHVRFVSQYVEGMSSPAEVGPAAKAAVAINPMPAQLAMLVLAFGRALKQVPSDDRTFTYWMTRDASVVGSLRGLIEACDSGGVPTRELRAELRSYLVRSLHATRCSDNVPQASPPSALGYVAEINKALEFDPPISGDEIEPVRIDAAARAASYWRSREARNLLTKARRLRFGSGNKPLTPAEKAGQDWQAALTDFLNDLEAWDAGHGEQEIDYFHQKSVLYRALLELVPEGPARDQILRKFAGFLGNSYLSVDSRIEWLLHAKFLIGQLKPRQGAEAAKTSEALGGLGDRNLRLYAGAELLLAAPQRGPG